MERASTREILPPMSAAPGAGKGPANLDGRQAGPMDVEQGGELDGRASRLVFDIRRFSTHDGVGIRTTVFFKGCPLRCAWCHNPEGISPQRRPMYFPSRCVGCGACLSLARQGGMARRGDGLALDPLAQEDWPALMDACPTGALRWDSQEMGVEQILEEVLKDAPFYRQGGGVTLSGGEPLLDGPFALALLKALKGAGLNTAVESALLVERGTLEGAMPYTDHLYADLKLLDGAAHRRYTGRDNRLIKANLSWLLAGPYRERITVRTPLIPTATATRANLFAIARFLAELWPDAAYELLNYNPLARDKYRLLNRPYFLNPDRQKFTPRQMEAFAAIARQAGLRRVFIDQ